MEEQINQYAKVHLSGQNYAHRTRDIYLTALKDFVTFVGTKKITASLVQSYKDHVTAKDVSAKTKNLYITSARSFMKFMAERTQPELHNVLSILTTVKDRAGANGALEIPTEGEIAGFFKALGSDTENPHASPYYVLAILILSTGLRIAEALSLKVGDVQEKTIVIGKGSKQRMVFPDAKSLRVVRAFEETLNDPTGRLFRFGPRMAQFIFSRASQGKITPHTLRHIYATRLIETGAPIHGVQKLLGHSSLSTTQRYLHVSDDFLAEVAYKFNSRKR